MTALTNDSLKLGCEVCNQPVDTYFTPKDDFAERIKVCSKLCMEKYKIYTEKRNIGKITAPLRKELADQKKASTEPKIEAWPEKNPAKK